MGLGYGYCSNTGAKYDGCLCFGRGLIGDLRHRNFTAFASAGHGEGYISLKYQIPD
jgi:hypothetical protein